MNKYEWSADFSPSQMADEIKSQLDALGYSNMTHEHESGTWITVEGVATKDEFQEIERDLIGMSMKFGVDVNDIDMHYTTDEDDFIAEESAIAGNTLARS